MQLRYQCKTCGAAVGGAVSRRGMQNPQALPVFDESAFESGLAHQSAAWRHQRAEHEAQRESELSSRRERYAEYRLSTEWQTRRRLVMQRQRGICQGCGTERAVDVHHLTYLHFQNELLFELVALCRVCHLDIAHGPRLSADDIEWLVEYELRADVESNV